MLLGEVNRLCAEKTEVLGEETMDALERNIMLSVLDRAWMDHLSYMDYLKSGIGLRAYAQRDPLTEYREEAYAAFEFMVDSLYTDTLRTILRIQPVPVPPPLPQLKNAVKNAVKKPNPFAKRPPTGAEALA